MAGINVTFILHFYLSNKTIKFFSGSGATEKNLKFQKWVIQVEH